MKLNFFSQKTNIDLLQNNFSTAIFSAQAWVDWLRLVIKSPLIRLSQNRVFSLFNSLKMANLSDCCNIKTRFSDSLKISAPPFRKGPPEVDKRGWEGFLTSACLKSDSSPLRRGEKSRNESYFAKGLICSNRINNCKSELLAAGLIISGAFLASVFIILNGKLLFVIITSFICVIFGFYKPRIAMMALIVYWPMQLALNPLPGVDLASGRLILIFLSFGWVLNLIFKKDYKIYFSNSFIIFTCILAIASLSIIFSANYIWGIRKLFLWFNLLPILFFIPIFFKTQKDRILLTYSLLAGVLLSVIIGLIQFFSQFLIGTKQLIVFWNKLLPFLFGNAFSGSITSFSSWMVNIGGKEYFRAIGLFPDPHMFAFSIALSFPLLWFIAAQGNKKIKLLALFLSLLFILALIFSFSRGAYIGFLSALVFSVGVWFFKRHQGQKENKMFITVLILAAAFLFLIIPFSGRLLSIFNMDERSNIERLELWHKGWEIMIKNPLLGVGLGNLPLEIDPLADYRKPIYLHNTYLDIGAESGVLALMLWLLMAVWLIIRLLKQKNWLCFSLALCLVWFLTHSFFDTAIFSPRIMGLLLVIMGLGEANENLKIKYQKLK